MIAYHGTNQPLDYVDAGSWITLDPEVAAEFALEKVDTAGGDAVILALEIDEGDVEWDVLSQLAGVKDDRGQLLVEARAVKLPA